MKSFISVDDGSNLTDISPVLTCIRSLSESEALWDEDRSHYVKGVSLKQLKSEIDVLKEDGFCFVVSLRDGSCLCTSDSITDHLGYPKDILVGQSMMNFVYRKDHITFANHLSQGLNACFIQGKRDDLHLAPNTFFCRLRTYHGLKFGCSVSDNKKEYQPFKITLHINKLIVDDLCVEKTPGTLCVKATATKVSSAYTVPEEIPAMTSFSTRHTASCHFSHVDASAVSYLGYLPQDMVGYSVFDFYHIDDIPQLKDIYELVVKEHGSSFRSKPYRFKAQNGCYIMLETEWSCFINPWSHKLEFVVGQHRVLKGPSNVNIFTPSETEDNTLSDEIMKESIIIQKEIKAILSQSMQSNGMSKTKRFCKRKRDVAFSYNRVDEGYVGSKQKGKVEKQEMDDGSNSDPDSVVMGDISPYREVNDSSISSETPPTVQQLRYQDNIERFFASQPKTYSDGSDEYNKNERSSNGEGYQGSSSGSGNGSGNTSKVQNSSPNYENKIQESSSNSSKCNMSSFTAGDSGYGKSLEKESPNESAKNQTNFCVQSWKKNSSDCKNGNIEKFSSCLALTEETLSVHNRINHKHLKQHQRKNKASVGLGSTPTKENWFQQKEICYGKHKKCSHGHNLTVSTPTQTEIVNGTSASQMPLRYQPCSATASISAQHASSNHIPHISHACLGPPTNCVASAPTPTPFFIPIVYMGSMPYYPPISAVHPQASAPFWPFTATAAGGTSVSFPHTAFPPCGVHANRMPPLEMQCSVLPTLSADAPFNLYSGIPSGVQSSGVTTTSLLTTATTTIASGSLHTFKNTRTNTTKPIEKIRKSVKSKDVNKNQGIKNEINDCDMQVDDTRSSSFTQSSSLQSPDKEEEMDYDVKKYHPELLNTDRVELSSEIAYRYQINLPDVNEVLKKDREMLKSMQQPDIVNKQLQMLQKELKEENESKVHTDGDFQMTEVKMLGLTTEEDVNEELEYREECLLQLMCEDS